MGDFLTDTQFENFRDIIYDESGIHFSSANRMILESRLKERLRRSELTQIEEYYTLISRNEEELKLLLDSVTTNLTRFFRNTGHFQTLENYVLPKLINLKREKGEKTIRMWSAGCSTGEEPYSVAMITKELLPGDISLEITASDLSLKSLMTAKEGFYPELRMNGVAEEYIDKYFEKKGNGYQIVDEIRKLIRFDYHNLKFDSGLKKTDVVFCRNVIIYFDNAAQKDVIERFWKVMNNHSYLFIGHSESLFGMGTQFKFLKTDWACIYEKNSER